MKTREGYPVQLWIEAEKLVADALQRIGYNIVPPGAGQLVDLRSDAVEERLVRAVRADAGVGDAHDQERCDTRQVIGGDDGVSVPHGGAISLIIPASFTGTLALTIRGGEA